MHFTGKDVYDVVTRNDVSLLHHANSVTTSCTFLQLKGVASRGYVEARGLAQTAQYTDADDKEYGIWNDVFTDGVDVHFRGGKAKGANKYGPVLFKLPVAVLRNLPAGSHVMVTKENPANWRDGEPNSARYFETIADLRAGYRFGDFKQHIVIRTPSGILPFPASQVLIDLDNPQRKLPDGSDAYVSARAKLAAAAKEAGIKISVTLHQCQPECKCVEKYAASPTFTTMF